MASGECVICNVSEHGNMLVLPQNVAFGGVFLFAFAFYDGECLAGGLLEFNLIGVSIELFVVGDVLLFALSYTVQIGGPMLLGDGILGKDGANDFV